MSRDEHAAANRQELDVKPQTEYQRMIAAPYLRAAGVPDPSTCEECCTGDGCVCYAELADA